MKIAIVGTGIAGNVAAYLLRRHHDITVFEAGNYVGGHTHTVNVDGEDGTLAVDTGFIVFNDRTYPNFIRLLDELDVRSTDSEMSFSVRADSPHLEYNGSHLNGLFAQRRNVLRPSFIRLIRDILRFNRDAPAVLESTISVSLGEFLRTGEYSSQFTDHYLIPMGAAIWSAEPHMMFNMPAKFFVQFFANHGLLSLKDRPVWKAVHGGSREYVKKLTAAHRDVIRLNTPVQSLLRRPDKVVLKARGCEPEAFDQVFLACHSDQALALLADPTPAEEDILGAIKYQRNEAVLHTDKTLMPRTRRAWASWNYHIPDAGSERATLTYHMNRLQRLNCREQYFVTLNSGNLIEPQSVLREIAYDHPVFTDQALSAQQRKHEINGQRRTYYCGAYWRNGFHEDGVVSALDAVARLQERERDAKQYLQRAS